MPDAKTSLVPPRWGDPFTNENGQVLRRPQAWIDEISRILSNDVLNLAGLEDRIAELEPNYIVIDATDSPYSAKNNDYLLVLMDAGDVVVNFPADGRFFVSRKGGSNTLTLNETVNGKPTPTILFDGTTMAIAKIIIDWRFV